MSSNGSRELSESDYSAEPNRRFNPLTGRWTLISSGRGRRPWSGRMDDAPIEDRPTHDPDCYLCPGNLRAGGERNPHYESSFVFTNDFASLVPDKPAAVLDTHGLLRAESVSGTCRVICFTPRHDLTLGTMSLLEVRGTVDLWAEQISELGAQYEWVQVFENRGAAMGASNPHPHGQIWAGSVVPSEVATEQKNMLDYWKANGSNLLFDYAALESSEQSRVVAESGDWLAVVPFWASWPFETIVIPKRSVARMTDLSDAERSGLAELLSELLARYDNLFGRPFPYSMGWHGAPGSAPAPHWQLHAHFYPPLLRANVQKFMVGYEMLAEAQRDLTPEDAAERLRAVAALRV